MDNKTDIGCCGAFCKTCQGSVQGYCKGCKTGYDTGERDISKAKCKMKICCFKEKKFVTCADCPGFYSCKIIGEFYSKNGIKYNKYRKAAEFIREQGYDRFFEVAREWRGAYGKI